MICCLSGCTFEYNVEITKDTIKEDNIVYVEGADAANVSFLVESIVNRYTGPTNSLGTYDQSVVNRNGRLGMSYKKDYSMHDYNYSVSFSACYDVYKAVKDDEEIIIATDSYFNCFDKYSELEAVTINLISHYEVISSNADMQDGNKLTWNIDRSNASNKSINVILDPNSIVVTNNNYDMAIILVLLLVLIGVIVLFVKVKGKVKDRI